MSEENQKSTVLQCPFCGHGFDMFSNAESFTPVKCPQCAQHFHVHIKLGEAPRIFASPDEFEGNLGEEIASEGEPMPMPEGGQNAPEEDTTAYK